MEDWLKKEENILSLVAHEIRGPLSNIVIASRVIVSYGGDVPNGDKFLKTIQRQANYLDSILDSITALTRMKLGKEPIPQEAVAITSLIDSALDACQFITERKRVKIEVFKPKNGIEVIGSQCLLCQVLVNLIQNAIKFSPVSSLINVSYASNRSECLISVRDHGIGMSEDQLQMVFDPFSQFGQDTSGMGLGLYLSKQIVELHGGRVGATSFGIGKGSAFHVSLPILSL